MALRHHLWAHTIGALRLTVGCWGPGQGQVGFDRERAEGDAAQRASPKETVIVVGDLRQCGRAETRRRNAAGSTLPYWEARKNALSHQ